jgi:hypothetical protein
MIGGVTEDVIQRWILDPTEYKKGIADIAKLVRDQQKNERDLATVRAELDKQTASLSNSLQSMSDQLGKAGISTSALAGGVGGLVAMIGGKLIGALGEAATKAVAFVNAGDDFNDTVEKDRASVWRMTEATQNMGSAMDVAKFRAKLMASEGLQPTEQQLESLTRAATNLAAKQKTDWASAADTLSNAWQGMGARALKPLNIDIEQSGTLLEKQRQILEGALQLGPAVLTQAEKERALIKEKDNAYLKLSATMNDNGAIAAAMNFSQVTRLQNEIAHVKSLEMGYLRVRSAILGSGLVDKIARASGLGGGMDALRTQIAQEQIDATAQTAKGIGPAGLQGAEVLGFFQTGKSKQSVGRSGGGSKDFTSPFGVAEWMEDSLKKIEDMVAARSKRIADLMQKNREGDVEAEAEGERGRLGEEFKKFTEQAGREKSVGKLKNTIGGGILGDEIAESAMKSADALEKYRTVVQGLNDDMGAFSKGALADFAGGMWSAADAAIQGGQSFGQAMLAMTKATLLGIAQQSTVKAIFNLAEAAAQWFNPYAVSMHLTAAAIYGSIAATTGAIGLGISAATATGTHSSAGPATGASHGANGYKPSYGTKENNQKAIVVNVWLGDKGNPAAALFTRQQVQAMMQ